MFTNNEYQRVESIYFLFWYMSGLLTACALFRRPSLMNTVWRRRIMFHESELKVVVSLLVIQTLGGVEWVIDCGF